MAETFPQQNHNPNQSALFELPEQDNFEYELLRGHERTDHSWKSSAELRTEYVRRTDDLIHMITDGVEVKDSETGEKHKEPYDFVVWLDKSSRPLSWMTKALWRQMAVDKEGNVLPEPQHRFVNIDRNQWTSQVDPNGVGQTYVGDVDPSIIRSLRSIFLANPADRRDGLTEQIDRAPTQFDGKNVLIVDELNSTGRTLQYAKGFFQRAFPEARIDGTHWMGEITSVGSAIGNADVPVWYTDTSEGGRGIGNRNIDRSRLSKSTTQKLGAWFLSTPLGRLDPKSDQLRKEIDRLAQDAKDGKILVEPSRERDDYEERVLSYNNLKSYEEFKAKRAEQIKSKI